MARGRYFFATSLFLHFVFGSVLFTLPIKRDVKKNPTQAKSVALDNSIQIVVTEETTMHVGAKRKAARSTVDNSRKQFRPTDMAARGDSTSESPNLASPNDSAEPGSTSAGSPLQIHADYPHASRTLGEEGRVLVDARLSPEGLIEDVVVLTSSGFSRLDHAAVVAVRNMKRLQPGPHPKKNQIFEFAFQLKDANVKN